MLPLEALERVTVWYAETLAMVSATDWESPSPCSDWTVRDVADHVVGGNRFAVALLAGQCVQAPHTAAFEGGCDDPRQQFIISSSAQLNAFATSALNRLLPHPAGE